MGIPRREISIMKKVLFIFAFSFLIGCAKPAEVQKMVYQRSQPVLMSIDSPIRETIVIENVVGGLSTNPMWKSKVGNSEFREALRRSLDHEGALASDPRDAKYVLNATLVASNQLFRQPERHMVRSEGFRRFPEYISGELVQKNDDGQFISARA